MPSLPGRRHPRVVAARELDRRSRRGSAAWFRVEGPHALREALAARVRGEPGLVELFATVKAADDGPLVAEARAAGVDVLLVDDEAMTALAETVTPQGIVGVAETRVVDVGTVLAAKPQLLVVLAAVADPGNAGTVIRVADAAGADAVVLTAGSVDPQSGKCVRATAGSLFHLAVAVGGTLPETYAGARAAGLTVVATDGGATDTVDDATSDGSLAGPVALIFGNESHGLARRALTAADRVIRVPLYGAAESLNLATAAAVCLYAAAGAQRAPGGCRAAVDSGAVRTGEP